MCRNTAGTMSTMSSHFAASEQNPKWQHQREFHMGVEALVKMRSIIPGNIQTAAQYDTTGMRAAVLRTAFF